MFLAPVPKRQKGARVVTEVRRSKRIAGLTAGYKSPNHAKAASAHSPAAMNKIKKNLSNNFKAIVIQPDAAPPPALPIDTIQALGVEVCQMPPEAVSKEALLYDSSDEY